MNLVETSEAPSRTRPYPQESEIQWDGVAVSIVLLVVLLLVFIYGVRKVNSAE